MKSFKKCQGHMPDSIPIVCSMSCHMPLHTAAAANSWYSVRLHAPLVDGDLLDWTRLLLRLLLLGLLLLLPRLLLESSWFGHHKHIPRRLA